MQLIDIIQLIFLGFIVISLAILITTYFTYRRRKQLIHSKKFESSEKISKQITNADQVSVLNNKPIEIDNSLSSDKSPVRKSIAAEKKKSKFEVFKPAGNNSPDNQPKTYYTKNPPKTK